MRIKYTSSMAYFLPSVVGLEVINMMKDRFLSYEISEIILNVT